MLQISVEERSIAGREHVLMADWFVSSGICEIRINSAHDNIHEVTSAALEYTEWNVRWSPVSRVLALAGHI